MKVYFFDTKEDVSNDVIGGKGLSLIQMTRMGLNVPYGFVLPTELWHIYQKNHVLTDEIKKIIIQSIASIEKKSGLIFGSNEKPLIISARSGAKFSMPGMMESILDVGITPDNLNSLIQNIGLKPALSSYQQFLRMFGHSVLEIDHKHFAQIEQKIISNESEEKKLRDKVNAFTQIINEHHEIDLNNTQDILLHCVMAVLDSFNSPGAVEYRNMAGIPHDIGTAVIVQQMVFGNLSQDSGSAVVFSRNFETGEKELSGHYLPCSQGENVVRGYSKPLSIAKLPKKFRDYLFSEIEKIEKNLKSIVDVEFTWEDINDPQKVFILQSREAKMPPSSYFVIQEKLVQEKIKTFEEVMSQVDSNTIYHAFVEKLKLSHGNSLITTGSPLNTGVGVGKVVFSIPEAKTKLKNNEEVILICNHFDPNDLELLTGNNKPRALVTTEGGPSSHMGLVLNVLNIPGIMGVTNMVIASNKNYATVGKQKILSGTPITIDSFEGKIYLGKGTVIRSNLNHFATQVKNEWERKFGVQNSWSDFINEKNKESVYQQFEKNLAASKIFKSKKAGQTSFINSCFGKDIAIYSAILSWDDIDGILDAIQEARNKNKGVWLRSAYNPDLLQAPYTSLDLTRFNRQELEVWFRDVHAQDKFSRFGNYQQWKEIHTEGQTYYLTHALVPYDEPGKLDKDLASEHFVCSLRSELGYPTRIVIDIFDGNPHTRILGQKLPSETMSIIILANNSIPSKIGQVYYRFGRNTFKNFSNIEDSFITDFNELLENGQQSSAKLAEYIDNRKLGVIKYIASKVVGQWWGKYDLPTRMWALNKITGASVLEIIGRYSDNKKWILIYGTKGEEENLIAKTAN